MENSKKKDGKPSASFVIGAVALLFLIIGYQAALFIHKAAVTRIIANHDSPDTVFVRQTDTESAGRTAHGGTARFPAGNAAGGVAKKQPGRPKARENAGQAVTRKDSEHSAEATAIRRSNAPRRYECFRFDPNTAGIDDLMRLGFSLKQAESIDNYRKKGGRFRRKSDFAKSYVVEDSVYARLEKYIDIPRLDINSADSVQFLSLPGIGKFFAGKMVEQREKLGGYSSIEQLMDIWHFDQEKFDGLKDLIEADTTGMQAYSLWTLPEKELAKHPYIGWRAAKGIVLFRENSPKKDWKVENLVKAGILEPEKGEKLSRCRIRKPE